MIKSWLNWLNKNRDEGVERRAEVAPPVMEITPRDIDPVTGALRWERFLAMFNAEQEQAPGVLLVVDLSSRAQTLDMMGAQNQSDILPWLAQAIRQAIRSNDLLGHVDGYRFAALLRGAPQEVGDAISARILESVDNTIFMTAEGIAKLSVTVGGTLIGERSRSDALGLAIANLDRARSMGTPSIIQ